MNINAINPLTVNSKLKLNSRVSDAPTTVSEGPMTTPQYTMNNLDLNNIAFQGLNAAKLASKVRNLGLASVAATTLLLGATSCEKQIEDIDYPSTPSIIDSSSVNITINDNSDITVIVNINNYGSDGMEALLLYMQQKDEKLFEMLQAWYNEWKEGELTNNEFLNKMYELMLSNSENQTKIIDLLVQIGNKTDEEAKAFLEQLLAEVKAGNLTAAEAYNKILEELGTINGKLDTIIAKLDTISGKVAELAAKQETRWGQLLAEVANFKGDMAALKESNELSNDYLSMLVANTDSLKVLLQQYVEQYGEQITLDDLKALIGSESEAWKQFIKAQLALHLDGVKGDIQTIKDYISLIEGKMATKEELQDQANRLEALLAKIDWNTAEALGVAQEIKDLLANFKCNCECTCNGDDKTDENEGILGDLEDFVNGNG